MIATAEKFEQKTLFEFLAANTSAIKEIIMIDRNNAASDLRAAAAKYYDFPQISMSTTSSLSGKLT